MSKELATLVAELEPAGVALFERHLATATEWFPHELVPWSRGRDFVAGEAWDPNEAGLSEVACSALFVNLLTEDNLPYYFRTLSGVQAGANWQHWVQQWTAEEGRHSIVMRDYLLVTRSIDPIALERGRMKQVARGESPEFDAFMDGLAYATLQELATRISHRNTGKLLDDQVGFDIMRRVAADENLHFLFYRDLASEILKLDPSPMVCAIERVVRDFAMPGTGIPDFEMHARRIADAGIYNVAIHHDQILVPVVLGHFDVEHLEGLDAEAEVARERLVKRIERIGRIGRRLEERSAAAVGSR